MNRPDFIFENDDWNVFLMPDQYYLGRSVIVAKRSVGSLSELKKEEWLNLADLIKRLESALKKAFGATMFNWTCLMNNAYQESDPKPQVHWHFRPRYSTPVTFANIEFEDKEFGHHYAQRTEFSISDQVSLAIVKEIQKYL